MSGAATNQDKDWTVICRVCKRVYTRRASFISSPDSMRVVLDGRECLVPVACCTTHTPAEVRAAWLARGK